MNSLFEMENYRKAEVERLQQENERWENFWKAKLEKEKEEKAALIKKLKAELNVKEWRVKDLDWLLKDLKKENGKLEKEKSVLKAEHERKEQDWDEERQALIANL